MMCSWSAGGMQVFRQQGGIQCLVPENLAYLLCSGAVKHMSEETEIEIVELKASPIELYSSMYTGRERHG